MYFKYIILQSMQISAFFSQFRNDESEKLVIFWNPKPVMKPSL